MNKTVLVILMLALSACAVGRFDPGRQVSVTAEQAKQSLKGHVFSGMACDLYCEITQLCTAREIMKAKQSGCRVLSPSYVRRLRR